MRSNLTLRSSGLRSDMASSADFEPRLRNRSGDIGVLSSSTGSLLMDMAENVNCGLVLVTGEMGFS